MCQPSTQINEVPYEETQQVLDNVENLIKDAEGKFEDPNIDLSILPPINLDNKDVIEESKSTTTTQSTVILSVTTVKNSVMDVVITPDTSSVEGTTLVVEKIKEIIDDIVRQENSGLFTYISTLCKSFLRPSFPKIELFEIAVFKKEY